MPRLIPCPHCHGHVLTPERECPHCGASLPAPSSLRAPAVLMGLTLAGCPVGEPEYGVADVGSTTQTPTTSATEGTDGETDAQTDSGSDSGGASSSGSSTGMADTGTETGATAGSSAGEPDYGVPETTSG